MYPDNAFYEFYPADIVDRVLRENPGETLEGLHRLMQAAWDAQKPPARSMAELADALGL